MVKSYIDKENDLIVMEFKGSVSIDDLNQNFDHFTSLEDFKYNMNSLIFIEKSTPNLNAAKMISHSEYVAKHEKIRGNNYKIALVSNDINWHRLVNLFKVSSKNKPFLFNYFDEAEEATHWLIKKRIGKDIFLKKIAEI